MAHQTVWQKAVRKVQTTVLTKAERRAVMTDLPIASRMDLQMAHQTVWQKDLHLYLGLRKDSL
jgi:hypothetical protein